MEEAIYWSALYTVPSVDLDIYWSVLFTVPSIELDIYLPVLSTVPSRVVKSCQIRHPEVRIRYPDTSEGSHRIASYI